MLVGLITTAFAAAPATKVLLDATKYPTARCLDGLMGAFYFSPATTASGRSKFYLHQEGGGGCNSVSDCAERSFSALGSSSPLYGWRSTYDLSHYEVFSRSEAESPLLHDWNHVFMVYCDGGYFSGNGNDVVTEDGGRRLHFRGAHILDAVLTLATFYGTAKWPAVASQAAPAS